VIIEIPIGDEEGRMFKIDEYPDKAKRKLFLESKNRRVLRLLTGAGLPLIQYDKTSLGFPMTFEFSTFCRILGYLEKKKGDGWEEKSEWDNW
jgi:hypothetical protein